jgi:trimeric autotransporter adhesin
MQTNAPAGSEFVDQFNRAVAFGQISSTSLSTITASQISDSTTAGRALLTAATVQAQRTALDILVSAANLAAFPASGNLQRVYLALDTAKTYVWDGTGYTEISPNQHARTGTSNINVGETALSSASLSGAGNSAVGQESLQNNTTGSYNSALGYASLRSNVSGGSLVAIGSGALLGNTIGSNSTAVGTNALAGSDAADNTAIGASAGATLTSGQGNTIAGSSANVDSGARSLCVVIGKSAISPAVDGSLSIGGTGGNAMGNLLSSTAGGHGGQHLRIYLNGTQYKIALLNP